MTKKEQLLKPELGMIAFHESISDGKEAMKVVGIRYDEVELEVHFLYIAAVYKAIGKFCFSL